MQRSTLSVGSALRQVRESRGITLEEAARDTRVRLVYLEALEAERFDRLLSDVHVRGCLRTYATYLRLSPDKVISTYECDHAPVQEAPAAAPPVRPEPALDGGRRRDDHRLWILVAVTVLVVAAAFGVLSARRSAPPAADLPADASSVTAAAEVERGVTVGVDARRSVVVMVIADGGAREAFALEPGEGRSFGGDSSVTIRLSEGASARVTVNGVNQGFPGMPGKPWKETYSYGEPTAPGG